MAKRGAKDLSIVNGPSVRTRTGLSLATSHLGIPWLGEGIPYLRPERLPCSPPKFEGNKWTGRSDLFELAVEIISDCGFSLEFANYEPNAIFEAHVQGRSIPFRLFPEEYLVIQDRNEQWWSVSVEKDNWIYDGGEKSYSFPIEDMLTTLPPSFFDRMGFGVKWAATVIRFEADEARLWQTANALSSEAREGAGFNHLQEVQTLYFKLGADLSTLAKDAEHAADAIENARAKKPDPDELERMIYNRLILEWAEWRKIGSENLADCWLAEKTQNHKKTEFGLRLEVLKAPNGKEGLGDMIERIAKAQGIIF